MDETELSGPWRAAPADEDLRRTFVETGFSDGAWEPIEVPSHWRSTPAFSEPTARSSTGRSFEEADAPEPTGADTRSWLVLDGVFYTSDVWLDGAYLGDTEGYFFPHAFEVTEALRTASEHISPSRWPAPPRPTARAKRNLTGVFQHWDCLDPDWNPGGIWRPVRIEQTGPVRIRTSAGAVPRGARRAGACSLRAVARQRRGRTGRAADDHRDDSGRDVVDVVSDEHPRRRGEQVEWTVTCRRTRSCGGRAPSATSLVYDVEVEVRIDRRGTERRATSSVASGCARVRMRDWISSVNGERLFLKGANQGPTRMALAEATARGVRARRRAGDGRRARPPARARPHQPARALRRRRRGRPAALAGLAAAVGLRPRRSASRRVRQAAEAVDLLGHHPSVVDLVRAQRADGDRHEPGTLGRSRRRCAACAVGRRRPGAADLEQDRARPVDQAGAREGRRHPAGDRPLRRAPPPAAARRHRQPPLLRLVPRRRARPARLPAGDAAPGAVREPSSAPRRCPTTPSSCEPERWPDLDWERLAAHHALQKAVFDRHVPARRARHLRRVADAPRRRTRPTVVRHHIETLRRLKYRPTGGFAQFCFADGHPAVTWSVLGHDRPPKLGYEALQAACAAGDRRGRPASRPPSRPGERSPSTSTW